MNDITKKNIGKKLNDVLAQKEIMQKELAEHLGVTANTISYYLSGERCPDIDKLIEISKFLNVSTDYLLGLSDVKSTNAELKGVCEYTGLSESAVNMLNSIVRHYGHDSDIISAFIAPDFNVKGHRNLTTAAAQLKKYESEYLKIIEEMSNNYKELENMPNNCIFEYSKDINNRLELAKIKYFEAIDTFRRIIDGYVDSKIETPENISIVNEFFELMSEREFEYYNEVADNG